MIILNYKKKYHERIIQTCVNALKKGKALVYPTDTSYGLAVDAMNPKAVKKLYRIKGRDFNKAVHVAVPSVAEAKKMVRWNRLSSKLAKRFWPGPLTLILASKVKHMARPPVPQAGRTGQGLRILSADGGFLGVRMPDNRIALDLAKYLKRPITATSANRSGEPDCYSAEEAVKQFKNAKLQPDIIIDAGKLPKRKPSTVVKIIPPIISFLKKGGRGGGVEVLRKGPISFKRLRGD